MRRAKTTLSAATTSTTSRPAHWANEAGTLFKNPWPSADEPTWSELYNGTSPVAWHKNNDSSVEDIDLVTPDWGAAILAERQKSSSKPLGDLIIGTWLGHAGALVEVPKVTADGTANRKAAANDSVFLVFDPIMSYRAGPTSVTGPARLRPTPMKAKELPGCDAVFISHNHYDHLDFSSVNKIRMTFPETMWFVPRGNKQWFLDSGVLKEKIVEDDWWDVSEHDVKGMRLKITSVPAQHNSARTAGDKNRTLWCGWVVERLVNGTRKGAIYHAGDTGYRRLKGSPVTCPAFKEIGERFNGFDLSFLPIWRGGTLGFISYLGLKLSQDAIAAVHHAYPMDAIEIHKDVRSRNSVAVHFGTFVGSKDESQESVKEFREACEKSKIVKFDEEDAGRGRADLVNLGASTVINLL